MKKLDITKEICDLIIKNPELPIITKIKTRNGYLQHYTLKNLKGLYATKETKSYKKCKIQQLSSNECEIIENVFIKIQDLIAEIIERLKNIINEN